MLDEIRKTLCLPETGVILGVDGRHVVTKFYPDITGTTKKNNYVPDVRKLNEIIREWAATEIAFIGFVHTHPKGAERLSSCDESYAKKSKKLARCPKF